MAALKTVDTCVEKVLVLSTGHIKKQDNDLLLAFVERVNTLPHEERYRLNGNLVEDSLDVLGYEFGFLLPAHQHCCEARAPEEIAEFEQALVDYGFSTAFVALIRFAAELECKWLQLDADADVLEQLPRFTW